MNQSEMNTERKKWIAALMGLAMPGLGQIYNGDLIKGVSCFSVLLVVYVIGIRTTVLLPDRMLVIGILITMIAVIGIYAVSIIDAHRKADNLRNTPRIRSYDRWYFYLAIWLLGFGIVTGFVYQYVENNFLQAFSIAGESMRPTVLKGDRVLADKTAYRRMPPKKGDVVVFIYPNNRSQRFIKRIEGLPGDETPGSIGVSGKVPPGFVYVLGDDRENSMDSRQFGFVPLRDVIGKVRQIYFSSGKDGVRWDRIGKPVG